MWPFQRKSGAVSIDTLIRRLEAVYATSSGVNVGPDNCEQSPTVKAILTAVTRRFAVMPVHVYLKTTDSNGRASKEVQPNHPVEKLLSQPNSWQTAANYWADAASSLLRYGNFYAYKVRGLTGPIQELRPLPCGKTQAKQDAEWRVTYETYTANGERRVLTPREIHHARSAARDYLNGDSIVMDIRETIALEIAAERMGATMFGNNAMPGLVFQYAEGSGGHKTAEERTAFLDDIKNAYSGKGRFKAMLLPKGIQLGDPIGIENEKAQFLQLRQYQRTVIAGAFGCPIHLVGDLSKGTFNNVEQQNIDFTTNMILPLVRFFEAAAERDLLTPEDRRGGIIIRFNPDAILRGDFKTRQEGLAIQRQNGIINANEWREHEGMNPRADDGGEDYFETGPSGQTPAGSSDGADTGGANDGSGDTGQGDSTDATD